MSIRTWALLITVVSACGDDDGGGGNVDAPMVPATITISGTASARSLSGSTPAADVAVAAFATSNESTPVAMATTDASGNYTLTVTTNGAPLDGFLKATKTGLKDTYLVPPAPLVADFSGASLNMVESNIYSALFALCSTSEDATKGVIALIVEDAAGNPVAGATVTSSPAPTKACYNSSSGTPSGTVTETAADGTAYLFGTVGNVTVSASGGGTFKSHALNVHADSLNTTLITP
ncbi:MAG TPA: hypothetical protein VFQ53_08225 [Kofleriaceae bacterium]|nr:hypothetical protein [Kofleriaceae bacterium]